MKKKTIRNSLGFSICIAVLACSNAGYAENCSPSKMTLRIQKYELDYRLQNKKKGQKCVTLGNKYQMEIKLKGDDPVEIPVGAIRVHEKEGTLTIRGTNATANPDSIWIEIGDNSTVDSPHRFYITVDGVGTIDPIVKVVDNNKRRLALSEALQAFADDYDLENATIEIRMPAAE